MKPQFITMQYENKMVRVACTVKHYGIEIDVLFKPEFSGNENGYRRQGLLTPGPQWIYTTGELSKWSGERQYIHTDIIPALQEMYRPEFTIWARYAYHAQQENFYREGLSRAISKRVAAERVLAFSNIDWLIGDGIGSRFSKDEADG